MRHSARHNGLVEQIEYPTRSNRAIGQSKVFKLIKSIGYLKLIRERITQFFKLWLLFHIVVLKWVKRNSIVFIYMLNFYFVRSPSFSSSALRIKGFLLGHSNIPNRLFCRILSGVGKAVVWVLLSARILRSTKMFLLKNHERRSSIQTKIK